MNENERPREKALRLGIESLSNRELLALLLRSGVAGFSALEVADQILGNIGMHGIVQTCKL